MAGPKLSDWEQDIEDLRSTALFVLRKICGAKGLVDAQFAVFGGLALQRYFPKDRHTTNVDFIVVNGCPCEFLNDKLKKASPKDFDIERGILVHHLRPGTKNPVIFWAAERLSFTPQEAIAAHAIQGAQIPYVSAKSLLVYKMTSCLRRATRKQKSKDKADARLIRDGFTGTLVRAQIRTDTAPLVLSDEEMVAVEIGVECFMNKLGGERIRWEEKLSLILP